MIDSLRGECVQIGTAARIKKEIIKEISLLAKNSPVLEEISAGEIEDALLAREQVVSTGLTGGMAIPHCSFEGLDDFVVGLLIAEKPLDFEALDGSKSELFFFIIGPKDKRNRHIKILSSISKMVKDRDLIDNITSSRSVEEVKSLLIRPAGYEQEAPLNKKEKCQFVIHIQREELFFDVLEILSSEVEGAVSVIDASTAGSYLHRLPLFSSFWNDKTDGFSKIIVSLIDKVLMNDTIRRINMVMPEDRTGIIISVTDIVYFDGAIDF